MGSIDKDNPAEDFYEKKHLNSDLICTNFTELTDQEFYDCLQWANTVLMENYFNKQRDGTLAQIKNLYEEKDVTFRGFRQGDGAGGGKGQYIPKQFMKKDEIKKRKQDIFQGNEVMDGMVNWENSSSDGDRFSVTEFRKKSDRRRGLKCFEEYLVKKEKRQEEKNLEKIRKAQIKSAKLEKSAPASSSIN